jgi:hypothetical protein
MAENASVSSFDPLASLGIVLASGVAGGIINCLMFDEGFTAPYLFKNKQGRTSLNPGFLSNIFLGIGASFLAWAFGANELNWIKQAGICFLAGTSGGNIILSFLQKRQLEVEKSKVAEYDDTIKELLGSDEEQQEE